MSAQFHLRCIALTFFHFSTKTICKHRELSTVYSVSSHQIKRHLSLSSFWTYRYIYFFIMTDRGSHWLLLDSGPVRVLLMEQFDSCTSIIDRNIEILSLVSFEASSLVPRVLLWKTHSSHSTTAGKQVQWMASSSSLTISYAAYRIITMRGRSQSRSRSRSRRRSPGSNRRHPSQRSYRNRSRSPRRRLQSSNRRSSPASNRGLSRQNAYQDRSRSPRRAQRSNKSRSNSPNRRDQSNPKGIEITLFGSSRSITDKSNGIPGLFRSSWFQEIDEIVGFLGLLIPQNATSSRRSKLGVVLQGPDFGQIDPKELKKIQIDIRRSIPSHRISGSPVRHDIRDPSRISFSRRPGKKRKRMSRVKRH